MIADGLWNPEGSRPESAKVSNQVTTGVLDQCMHSRGWRGNSGEPIVSLDKSRFGMPYSKFLAFEEREPRPLNEPLKGHESRRVYKVSGADS